MKRIIIIIIFGLLVQQLQAQLNQEKKPSTIVFHVFYNDFKTAQQIKNTSLNNVLENHLWSKFSEMQMGFGFNYLKGITKHIDFTSTLDGSWTDYLYKDGSTNGQSEFLLDVNAGANIKLLTDRHTLVPYFTSGAGFSLYKSKLGFYLPVGIGIQFNVFDEAFVFTNMQYRFAIGSNANEHLYYTIGVGVSIGRKKAKSKKIIEEPIIEIAPKESIIVSKDIVVTVIDEATKIALANVQVNIKGLDGKSLSGSTNPNGKLTFKAMTVSDYVINAKLNNINASVQNIKKGKFETNEQQINITLTHYDPRFTLYGIVVNKTQNSPEGGANINITNKTNQSSNTVLSRDNDGVFKAQLGKESDFTIIGKKANYISNIEKASTKGLNRSTTLYVKLKLEIEEAKVGQSIVLNNIYFEISKANLNTSFSSDLDKIIQFLNDNPETKLEIQGHTDNTGSLAFNTKLSQKRANSVVNYLTKKGVDSSRLSAKGFGPSVPVASNESVEGRAKNRRVEMKVIK